MLPIKPVCTKKDMRKDGTSIIFLQYCYSIDKRTLLNTGIAIPPSFWNRKKLRINDDLPLIYGEVADLNQRLQTGIRIAQDTLTYAVKEKVKDLIGFLKNTFRPGLDLEDLGFKAKEAATRQPETNLDFYFQIDDYIRSKTNKVTPGMLRVYKNMKDHLQAFQDYRKTVITFDALDFNFYEALVDFLTFEYVQRRRKTVIKGLKTATVGKTIKQLRIFIRDRIRRKIISPIDLSDFKILNEESDQFGNFCFFFGSQFFPDY